MSHNQCPLIELIFGLVTNVMNPIKLTFLKTTGFIKIFSGTLLQLKLYV